MIEREFQSRSEVESHQLAALGRLIGAVRGPNPFWTPKLEQAGVDADISSLAEFTERLGLIDKSALSTDQSAHPPYGTNLTFPIAQYCRLHQTSSTSGSPIRWLDTADDWQWLLDGWQIVFEAAGVETSDRVFVASSFGPFIGFWIAWDCALRMGCMAISGGGMNTQTRIRAIVANAVTVLCCTPTYAIHLGQCAIDEGIDTSSCSLRRRVVAGEPGGSIPAVRERIEQLWPGAQVFDHHGMTETGPVTFECPANPGVLHVIESSYFCEVIDPETCESVDTAGQATGELVITPLGRIGSPVFRYRTGDLVRVQTGEPCPCGRCTMRIIGGILSRCDDMVIVRGTNVYPGAVAGVLARIDEIVEYEVHVVERADLTELVLLIEPRYPNAGPELKKLVAEALRDAFNLRFDVRVVPVGALPHYEFKEHRWKRRVMDQSCNRDL
jgi:phenylacetate-CoA ligase